MLDGESTLFVEAKGGDVPLHHVQVPARAPFFASPLPQPGGTLTLTGLGGSPLTIQVYSLGVLITPGLPDQVWTVPDFVTAALTISGYWTYDGLYDAGTGAWEG